MALSVGNVLLRGPQSGGGARAGAESFGAREAEAAQRLGQVIGISGERANKVFEERRKEREEADYLKAEMALDKDLTKLDFAARKERQGASAAGVSEIYEKNGQDSLEKIASAFGDPRKAEAFKARPRVRARLAANSKTGAVWEIEQENAYKQEVSAAHKNEILALVKDPNTPFHIKQAAIANFDPEQDKILPYRSEAARIKDREDMRAAMRESLMQGVVAEAVSNPSAVLASAQAAMFGHIQDGSAKWGELAEIPRELQQLLTPAEYASLMSYAHDAAGRQLAAQLRMDGEALKSARENAEKELYEMLDSGTLTRDAVEERRDILPAEFYGKTLAWASGQGGPPEKSDPAAIMELTTAVINGGCDLQALADEALRAGRITIGDYHVSINEGELFRDPLEKQIMGEIKLLSGHSDMNPNPAAAESCVSAKRDYLAWRNSEAGQKATPQERREMGLQTARNRRLNSEENILAGKIPLYLEGSGTMPDIKAAIEKTVKAYRNGKLAEPQYKEQLVRIKRFNDFIERRRAAEETAANRGGRR